MKTHSTGSLDWCMVHCSGTPCRLNCLLSSSVKFLSPVFCKSERVTLDWVWLYLAQLVFPTQNMLISVLGIIAWAKPSRIRQTWVFLSMKYYFLARVRPVAYAYLNNIFWIVVVCTITAMRRGEKQKDTWVFKFLCKFNYSKLSQSLASMSYVLSSYRSCDQVKPEICWRRSQGQSRLLKTIQERQMERRNLQKWQTNTLSTLGLLDSNAMFIIFSTDFSNLLTWLVCLHCAVNSVFLCAFWHQCRDGRLSVTVAVFPLFHLNHWTLQEQIKEKLSGMFEMKIETFKSICVCLFPAQLQSRIILESYTFSIWISVNEEYFEYAI